MWDNRERPVSPPAHLNTCVCTHHWANEWFFLCWQRDGMWVRAEQQDLRAVGQQKDLLVAVCPSLWAPGRGACHVLLCDNKSPMSSSVILRFCLFNVNQQSRLSDLQSVIIISFMFVWYLFHLTLLSALARFPHPQMRLTDSSVKTWIFVCWDVSSCHLCEQIP